MARYVAYFRVSTEKQGRSGLGLAAQRTSIERFLTDSDEIITEYVEVHSGKKDNRTELWKAIDHAKRNKAKILIAKLDRFSRKVSFIARLMDEGIGLTIAEMPNATDFQLHIFAALAQEERRLISERTCRALAEAKRRGVELGTNGKALAAKHRRDADARAISLAPIIKPMLEQQLSLRGIAQELNARGIKTARNNTFSAQQVKNVLLRLNRLKAYPMY